MRRVPEAMDSSDVILNNPMSPVARTCVPPQSSFENASPLIPGPVNTRTLSEYFSPKSAIAPDCMASSRLKMAVVKTQVIWRNHRACLLDVRAEDFAQRGVEQVRRRVIAPRRVTFFNVNLRAHFVSDAQRAALNRHAM